MNVGRNRNDISESKEPFPITGLVTPGHSSASHGQRQGDGDSQWKETASGITRW